VADKAIMWKKRCPKQRAWYVMEMDQVKPGSSKRSKVNSESLEDRHAIRCSKCHKDGHNRQRCEENVRTSDMMVVINLLLIMFFIFYHNVCVLYLYI
jgi:hypothetical protein